MRNDITFLTSLHVDLNEAAKCPYRAFGHAYNIQNGDDIWLNLRRLIVKFMKVQGLKTWKEVTTGDQQLVRLLFNNDFVSPFQTH